MWNVILHFNRGSVQTLSFEDKFDALKCVEIAVFKNEDCINCSIYKDTKSVIDDRTQKALDTLQYNLDLLKKIKGKM